MPCYTFHCKECSPNDLMEVQLSFDQYDQWKIGELNIWCNICKCGLSRVMELPDYGIIDKTPKTLGTLADKNTRKLGKYHVESLREAKKAKETLAREELQKSRPDLKLYDKASTSNLPEWAKPDISLAKLTPKQQERYILEGKK